MVFTVTLNPAIDKTVVLPGFTLGAVNRIQSLRADPGGKGINVSKCLAALGLDTMAAGIFAGTAGELLLQMLQQMDIPTLPVMVSGQSRTNLKIIDPAQHSNTDINEPGPAVSPDALTALRDRIGQQLRPGDVVVLSGSLPAGADSGLYRDWIGYFRERGARVILDADGEPLRQGILAKPWLIKPNDAELSHLLNKPLESIRDLVEAGEGLRQNGIEEVVISLGSKGALFLSGQGRYLAEALSVPVQSTVGAGDSMVAAMAYGSVRALPRTQIIQLAVAMGAASCMCDGTQAPDAGLVEKLSKQVKIMEV